MKARALLLALAVAGCATPNEGTAVLLTLDGHGVDANALSAIRELDFAVAGAESYTKIVTLARPFSSTGEVILYKAKAQSGTLTLAVAARDGNGAERASGSIDVALVANKTVDATLVLGNDAGDMGPGGGDGGMPPVVTPATASVPVARAQAFSADQPVQWRVMEANGGSIAADGSYLAPDTPGTYHVVATAAGGATTATVTVTPMALKLVAGRVGGPGNLDGLGTAARFGGNLGIAASGSYVADKTNHVVRAIGNSFANYPVTTLAGSGVAGDVDGVGKAAQLNSPSGVAADSSSVYVADTGNGKIRQIAIATGAVTTLASGLRAPTDVIYDGANSRLIVSDPGQFRIFTVSLPGGAVAALAGSGTQGSADNANGLMATFQGPTRLSVSGSLLEVLDGIGTLRTVDLAAGNNAAVVTRITPGAFAAVDGAYVASSIAVDQLTMTGSPWTTTLVAGGTGGSGDVDGTGASAVLSGITDMKLGTIADGYSIRTLASGNKVTTIAGATPQRAVIDGVGAAASYDVITQIASDGADALYSIGGGATLRKTSLSTGTVTSTTLSKTPWSQGGIAYYGGKLYATAPPDPELFAIDPATGTATAVAGQAGTTGEMDGVGAAATFETPGYLVSDGKGTIYISDWGNNDIRAFDVATARVTRIAGNGAAGNSDGVGSAASFARPDGLALDGTGALYVADRDNYVVRKIDLATNTVSRFAGIYGTSGTADGPADQATFPGPWSLAYDGHSLYVSSMAPDGTTRVEGAVRRIDLQSKMVTHFIGQPPLYGFALGPLPSTLNAPGTAYTIALVVTGAGDLVVGQTTAIAIVQP